ncbi:hypothetical protein JD844_015697 [Phrynosoma platyrhinos]|uniref:Uncharacterized protein n=1 Tax=Phrynosoma platyrhinos TaxID=52577 RepID=A0ABQ7SJD7_PHRPL|nr:hypothetical protein JD844_015697 [Phrynosoma platyrhinos]
MPFYGNTNLLWLCLSTSFYKGFSFLKCKLLTCVFHLYWQLPFTIWPLPPSHLLSFTRIITLIACHQCTIWVLGLHIYLAFENA